MMALQPPALAIEGQNRWRRGKETGATGLDVGEDEEMPERTRAALLGLSRRAAFGYNKASLGRLAQW